MTKDETDTKSNKKKKSTDESLSDVYICYLQQTYGLVTRILNKTQSEPRERKTLQIS